MAAPLDVTWAGALEEGVTRVIAAVEEGGRVVPEAEADEEAVADEAVPDEGTTEEEGCTGAALLRGAETVDATDGAVGTGGDDETDEAGGASTDDTGAGGGAYEWPGGAGAGGPGVAQSLTVTVTVAARAQVAGRGVSVRYVAEPCSHSRSATTAQISAATAKSFMPNMLMVGSVWSEDWVELG
jgi:hypothetical protein